MTIIPASTSDQTAEIQSALDAMTAAGGGRVVLAAGEHPCGALRLRDGNRLHLEAGAILRLTPDYDSLAQHVVSVIAEGSDRALIVAQRATGISITGEGEIAAPGPAYIAGDDPEVGTWVPARLRPRVLVLEDCSDVEIADVRITGSPMWTMHLVACRNVRVTGVRVENDRRLPNTDGLVIDSCHDVLVEDVEISTADDGVCLKTTHRATGIGTCSNVTVRNCRVSSQSCALKIGTESFGDITGIVFEDCAVVDSNRALGIFSRDGGRIGDVRFSRITVDCHETPDGFWGSGEALTVTVVTRRPELPAGPVSGLIVEDISGIMEGAINLVSLVPGGIGSVQLSRITLTQRPGKLGTARRYDLRPTPADLAPPPTASGRPNAWTKGVDGTVIGLIDYPTGLPGLFTSGVDGLSLDDVVVGGWSAGDQGLV